MREPEVRRRTWPAVIGALLPLYAAPTGAAQVDYGIGYAGETSSNVRRTATDHRSEWTNSIIGGFTYAEDTADFTGRATLQGEYRNYARDTVPDDSLFLADVDAVWTIMPRRFTWTLEDAFREVSLDPTAAPTTVNLAGANVFNTGPDFFLHFGPVHTVALGARYGNVYVGDQDINNNRYTGTVRWLYQSSPNTTWSLNYEGLRVEYDNDVVNENFRRNDAYFRVEKHYTRSLFAVDLGRSAIKRARSGDIDGSLSRLSWQRELSTESNFGISLASGYQDLGTQLAGTITGPTVPVGGIPPGDLGTETATRDLYYLRQADVFYTRRGPHLGLSTRVVGREYDYQTALQDRDETGGSLQADYFYSVTTTFSVFGDYLKSKYRDIVRQDEDTQLGVRMSYLIRRNVTFGIEARRVERASTEPTSEFVDNRLLLTLMYSTGPLYTPFIR